MKKFIFVITAVVLLPWTTSSILGNGVNKLRVAEPEPGYLCSICPRCCKEKEIEEEDDSEIA